MTFLPARLVTGRHLPDGIVIGDRMGKADDLSAMSLALALWLGCAATAQGQAMDAPACARLQDGLTAMDGYEATIPPSGPDQGWCVLDGAMLRSHTPGWPNLSAERLRIRQAVTEVEIDLAGLRVTPRLGDREVEDRVRAILRLQSADLRLRAVQDPATGLLTLSEAQLDLSGGSVVRLTAEIRGAELSLASLGRGVLTHARLEWRSDGRLLRPVLELVGEGLAGKGLAGGAEEGEAVDAARKALSSVVAALPDAAVDPDSRKALAAMVAALPQGRGWLTLDLTAEEGIGAARIAVAALTGDPLSEPALAGLLEGATLVAGWQPGLAP